MKIDELGRGAGRELADAARRVSLPDVDHVRRDRRRVAFIEGALTVALLAGIAGLIASEDESPSPPSVTPSTNATASTSATAPTTSIVLTAFDTAAFMDSKLFGAFSPDGRRVGVVVLSPPNAEQAIDAAIAEFEELDGYTMVPSEEVVFAAERFATAEQSETLGGEWIAFGLWPRFGDTPTDDWVGRLRAVPDVQVLSVPFEAPAARLPAGWQVIADLPFPISGGAIVAELGEGVVVVRGEATYLIRPDGTWETALAPPISVPDNCCGNAAGYAIGSALVLIDDVEESSWVFDSSTLTWRQTDPRPKASFGLGSAVINGELWLVEAAARAGAPKSSVTIFDPSTGRWRTSDSVPSPISVGGVTTDGSALFVAGTRQDQNNVVMGDRTPDFYRYIPGQGWAEDEGPPIDGQASTIAWVPGAGVLAWNYDQESALLNQTGDWFDPGTVPMDFSECYPRSMETSEGVVARCGGLAWFDGETQAWQPISSNWETAYIATDTRLYGIAPNGRDESQLIQHPLPPTEF